MSNDKKKAKLSSSKLWTRVLCIILAFLMIASVAYLAIQLIYEGIAAAASDKKDTASAISVTLEETYNYSDIYESVI